jgi:hypothetical protein
MVDASDSLLMSETLLSVLDPDSICGDEEVVRDGHDMQHAPGSSRVDVRVSYDTCGGTCQNTKTISGDLLSLRSGQLWSVSIGVTLKVARDIARIMRSIDSISISFDDHDDDTTFSTFVVDNTVIIDLFERDGSRSDWIFNISFDERLM